MRKYSISILMVGLCLGFSGLSMAEKLSIGSMCKHSSACSTGYCSAGLCAHKPGKSGVLLPCQRNSDCKSGSCSAGTCNARGAKR